MDSLKETVKTFVLEQFLPGESPEALGDATPLITGGILDSFASLTLVAFLEKQYGIRFEPHEIGVDNLNTLEAIEATVRAKL